MFVNYLYLVKLFLGADLKVYNKYKARLAFSFFQIFTIVFLFHYISKMVGEVPLLKTKYFPFVASGLAFQFLFSGIVNAATEKMREYRDYGILEEILFSQYPPYILFLSVGFQSILIAVTKCLLLIFCIGLVFDIVVSIPILSLTLLILAMLALSLSFIGTCSFLIWKRFNLLEIGGSLFTLFLTGIYFPVSILPQFLQAIAELNPLKHGLELFRFSLGFTSDQLGSFSFNQSILILSLFISFLLLMNIVFYRYTLRVLKKSGVTGHF